MIYISLYKSNETTHIILDNYTSPTELSLAISDSRRVTKFFIDGSILFEQQITIGCLSLQLEWKEPVTDELALGLPEKENREYQEWKAAQMATPSEEVSL